MSSASGSERSCSRCGCPIPQEDVTQGLAVQIGKELVCSACVDLLPSDTQMRINRLRAARGFDVPVYQVELPSQPSGHVYTFATSAGILKHCRLKNEGKTLEAPPLPEGMRQAAVQAEMTPLPSQVQPNQGQPSRRGSRLGTPTKIGLFAGSAIIGGIMAIAFFAGGAGDPKPDIPQKPETLVTRDMLLGKTADQGWLLAFETLGPDHALTRGAEDRLRVEKQNDLTAAMSDIGEGLITSAEGMLTRTRIPADARFEDLRKQEEGVRRALEALRDIDAAKAAALNQPSPQVLEQEPEQPVPEPQLDQDGVETSTDAVDATASPWARASDKSKPDADQPAPEVSSTDDAQADAVEPISPENSLVIPEASPEPDTLATTPTVTGPAFLIPAETMAFRGTEGIDHYKDTRIKNIKEGVAVTAGLSVKPGEYALWARVHGANGGEAGTLKASYDGLELGEIEAAPSNHWKWVRFPTVLKGTGKELDFRLTFGTTVYLESLMLAPPKLAAIDDASRDALDMSELRATPPKKPALNVKVISHPTKAASSLRFGLIDRWDDGPMRLLVNGDPKRSMTRFSRDAKVIATTPGGGDRILFQSERHPRKELEWIQLTFPAESMEGGGIAFLVHTNDRQLRELTLTFRDTNKRPSAPITTRPLDNQWHAVALPLDPRDLTPPDPDGPTRFNPQRVEGLTISAKTSSTFWFYVARIALVSGRPPTVEDLGMGPPPLRVKDNGALRSVIQKIGNSTRHKWGPRQWATRFDGNKVQVLLGTNLINSFKSGFREVLAEGQGINPSDLPDRSVDQLVMDAKWLNGKFIDEIVTNNLRNLDSHIVVIGTAGVEALSGLENKVVLPKFWERAIKESIARGCLPVVMLGPTKVDEARKEQVDQLWQELLDVVLEKYPGVPIIDLRGIGVNDNGDFLPHHRSLAIERFRQAWGELQERLRFIKAQGR